MTDWKNCIRIGIIAFSVYLCIHYWDAAVHLVKLVGKAGWPLFLGMIIAYVINILMSFLENISDQAVSGLSRGTGGRDTNHILGCWNKIKRPVCMTAAYLMIILVFYFIVSMILPELVNAVQLLIKSIPAAMDDVMKHSKLVAAGSELKEYYDRLDWDSLMSELSRFLNKYGSVIASGSVSAVTTLLAKSLDFILAVIFSIYILLGKERLCSQIRAFAHRYIPGRICKKLAYVLSVSDKNFHNYIVGQCTEAVILGGLCCVGMLIFRFPYAVMIGILVGATALIPVAGAYIGAVVGVILIFTVSPVKALLFVLFILVLQQLEGNLIYPKVVGNSIGLPGIWVLAAVTVGGSLYGITGMLLGVPLFAILYQIMKDDIREHSEKSEERD